MTEDERRQARAQLRDGVELDGALVMGNDRYETETDRVLETLKARGRLVGLGAELRGADIRDAHSLLKH